MPDDRLTAELDYLTSIHRPATLPTGERVCDSDRHKWPCHAHRLLAALDAVLNLADDASPRDCDHEGIGAWWDLDPAEVRQAITRALNGDTSREEHPACRRIGGCLAETGAKCEEKNGPQDPGLWHCSCGRTPRDITRALAGEGDDGR